VNAKGHLADESIARDSCVIGELPLLTVFLSIFTEMLRVDARCRRLLIVNAVQAAILVVEVLHN
jgi:hypothetical protein